MTEQLQTTPTNDHAELANLIPWYVKGTLPPKEQAIMKLHLASCEACRQEVLSCETLANYYSQPVKSWQPSTAHFAGILAEVDKLEKASSPTGKSINTQPKTKRGAFQQLADWLMQCPAPVRWTLAAETFAVAALALFVLLPTLQLQPDKTDVYETLSNAETPRKSAGALIRLTLADDMTTKELSDLLNQAKAQIQQGPSAVGSYAVSLAPADAEQALIAFRKHPKVRLAQPIESGAAD